MFNAKECIFPWTELQINYDGTYGTCCYHVPFERTSDNFHELWNSPNIQSYRNFIKKHDAFPDSRCHNCPVHKVFGFAPSEKTYFAAMNYDDMLTEQQQNIRLARCEFEEKNLEVKHYPLRVYLNFGLQCNLSCIMCSQMGLRKAFKETLDPAFVLKNMDFLSHASDILIIGGEPFLLKPALDFLEFASEHEKLKNIRFTITTNATLLDRHVGLLSKFKHLQISCSIDSSGESYEKIRAGAKWEKVKANIEMLNELRKRRPDWLDVSISCLLMKSGIPGLLKLCEWCVENELAFGFARVFDDADPSIRAENMFDYPEILDDMPEWENVFFDCIALLNKHNYRAAANQLVMYYSGITGPKSVREYKSNYETVLRQRNSLAASRWRKLGQKLGIVKVQPFEEKSQ
jgi:MoaA/NifB/PqqE/SkfB family radical SAM enzyme